MATQTRQDAWIENQLRKATAAIETLRQVYIDGNTEKQMYRGAVMEKRYEKFLGIVLKAIQQIDNERKRL